MSTYLVAFVVSNFKSITKFSPIKGIKVDVVARPNAIDDGEGNFALE